MEFIADRAYAVHYVDNLRTGRSHQIAIVTGETASQMMSNASDPRRLVFVLLP